MKSPKKVLVAAPTYKGMEYCLKRFLEGIKNLTYTHKKLLIVDNSPGEEYFKELKKEKNMTIIKDNSPEKEKIKRLISSRNKIIDYALEHKFDYIFMLDSDILPPKNIIEELLACKKDLVSGIYFNCFIDRGETKILPVAWKSITKEEFEILKKSRNLPGWIKSPEDLRRNLTKKEIDSEEVLEVLMPSAGCMLISKKVFEKIRYGLINTQEMGNEKTGDDTFFILEAKKRGFKAYCNTKLKCTHMTSRKLDKKNNKIKYTHPWI